MRGLLSVGFLLSSVSLYAAHPAPMVQVTVKNGAMTVFKGITDAEGRFATAPLEPGVYRVETRGIKTVTPVRYFLALAGARPVGPAMTNADGDLAMPAQVRRPTSIRGQVRSSHIIRVPSPNSPANLSSSAPATNWTSDRVPSTSPAVTTATLPSQVAAVGSGSGNSTAMPSARPIDTAPASSIGIRNALSPQPRMIGGKRYIWVSITGGSNLGRWVLDTRQRAPIRSSSSAGR